MTYTSFEGFDGNPRKKETWLMLRQAFEERGIDIARPEKYSIVQERMFTQMKNGIDKLPAYKWQDGAIVEATHNDNTDYEFRKLTYGSALGKEQKLEYFANACKKELCERTIKKGYWGTNLFLNATHTESQNDYIREFIELPKTYKYSNGYGVPYDLYVIWEYEYDYYLYQRRFVDSSAELVYKEEDKPYNGRGVNNMLPNTPCFLGRVDAGENFSIDCAVGDGFYTDAAQYITGEDFMTKKKFKFHATPTFCFDFIYTMK